MVLFIHNINIGVNYEHRQSKKEECQQQLIKQKKKIKHKLIKKILLEHTIVKDKM